jgi:hypothetical protein
MMKRFVTFNADKLPKHLFQRNFEETFDFFSRKGAKG